MVEIVVPVAGPPVALAPDADAHARLDRLVAAREALRAARQPPVAAGPPSGEPGPLPPSFEEALIARAAFAAANLPPPPPPPPPPETIDPTISLWGSERDDPRAGEGPPVGLAIPLDDVAAISPEAEWRPPDAQAAREPLRVDPQRLAADPRSLFSAEIIGALEARRLGALPLRPEPVDLAWPTADGADPVRGSDRAR